MVNLKNKVKEIWAILDHSSSTLDKPKHDNCPKEGSSWCPYQRDIPTGQRTYKPTKWLFTKAIADVLHPLFIQFMTDGFSWISTKNLYVYYH